MPDTTGTDWYAEDAHRVAEAPQPSPQPGRTPWLLMAVLVVAASLMAGAAWWQTHPAVFRDGPGVITTVEPGAPTSMAFGITGMYGDGPSDAPSVVTLDAVEANGTPADLQRLRIDYVACRLTPVTGAIGSADWGSIGRFCSEVRAFVPGMVLELPAWELLAVVTPLDDAPTALDGFRVDYRQGIRSGSQVVGPEVVVNAVPGTELPTP